MPEASNPSALSVAEPAPIDDPKQAVTDPEIAKKRFVVKDLFFSKTGFLVIVSVIAVVILGFTAVEKFRPTPVSSVLDADPLESGKKMESRAQTQSKRPSLAQVAAQMSVPPDESPKTSDEDNRAFPDGSAVRNSVRPTNNKASDKMVRRNVREPQTRLQPSSVKESSTGRRAHAIAAAGQPAIHPNGQQQAREMMGKQRTSAAAPTQPLTGEGIAAPEAQTDGDEKPTLADDFAPYGRLIKCELVFTVDSINLNTPIVALVMEDVWWNGKLIIPAQTEAFSKASPNRVRNRIADDGKWVFVLPDQDERINGRELILKGFALDRSEVEVERDGRVRAWSLNDGSAGLQGFVVDDANLDKIHLFLATALSGTLDGISQGLQTRESIPGIGGALGLTQAKATAKNALIGGVGKGAKATIDLFSQQILEEVQKNGAYIRVPAGKQFYVFIDQSIDPLQAGVGKRISNEQ